MIHNVLEMPRAFPNCGPCGAPEMARGSAKLGPCRGPSGPRGPPNPSGKFRIKRNRGLIP